MKEIEEVAENIAKEMAKEIAKVKDAFIMEELKPYYKIKDGKIIFTQEVKIRLAEIQDFKNQVREVIDRMIRFWEEERNSDYSTFSHIYVDALQCLRKNILGEVLP